MRRGLGLSQRAFAEILGIPASTYRSYETDGRPVPLDLRRKIGEVTTLDINPLDPNEEPRRVLDALMTLSPDDLHPKLRGRLNNAAAEVSEPAEQDEGAGEIPATELKDRANLLQRGLAFRRHCLRARKELYTRPRQIYNNLRDGAFTVALNYFIMKLISLQLDIPFGAAKGQIDFAFVGSIAVIAVLLVAVFQAIPVGLRLDRFQK